MTTGLKQAYGNVNVTSHYSLQNAIHTANHV